MPRDGVMRGPDYNPRRVCRDVSIDGRSGHRRGLNHNVHPFHLLIINRHRFDVEGLSRQPGALVVRQKPVTGEIAGLCLEPR